MKIGDSKGSTPDNTQKIPKDNHLKGYTEKEVKLIKLYAQIYVGYVLKFEREKDKIGEIFKL